MEFLELIAIRKSQFHWIFENTSYIFFLTRIYLPVYVHHQKRFPDMILSYKYVHQMRILTPKKVEYHDKQ